MIKVVISQLGAYTYSKVSYARIGRRFFHSLNSSTPRNGKLEDKARSLIFGKRKYTDFTPKERKIVDYYQQKKLEEGMAILPNTGAALEQAEIEQILFKRILKKHV